MFAWIFLLVLAAAGSPLASANRTATWLEKRNKLIGSVYGRGDGVLPTQEVPDEVLTWPSEPGLQGLVWNISNGRFPITSTVFFSAASGDPNNRSKSAFLFHHGHSDCVCDPPPGANTSRRHLVWSACHPGCNSSMPSYAELEMPGYSWWDLYNVSDFFHSLGHDVFILSMPLKGINYGLSYDEAGNLIKNETDGAVDHWWFLQWEKQGDAALRYFLEPAVLTANYAKAHGYEWLGASGLSGGGWSTTFMAAIDKRINASFPIAGSTPCALRNPVGQVPGQVWTGGDNEDFEQNCSPNPNPFPDPKKPNEHCNIVWDKYGAEKEEYWPSCPGRPAFSACNYTCQYLLAGLEPGRYQVQILHEYDTCCFSAHGRHDKMLKYEAEIRAELMADDRAGSDSGNRPKHGWFTETANNHSKHEVCAQDKTIIAAALAGKFAPATSGWDAMPCDIMHQALPANCDQNVEPGLPPGQQPSIPDDPENQTETGFKLLGFGACRDKEQKYPPWGSGSGTNAHCAAQCLAHNDCIAYMSTQNEKLGQKDTCQFYCKEVDAKGLCTKPGTGAGPLTTTDGSQTGALLRFCWLKDQVHEQRAARRQGPWINMEL